MRLVIANQATASKRRVYFDIRDVDDGITPEAGEAAGQPQISTNGGAWTNTGIGTLAAIGNGRYYADLTQGAVATTGDVVETRYKSAATAETPGDSVQVLALDIDTATASLGANAPAGWINAAAIAADAIDADAIAPDAVTEIQSGLATAANLATVAGYLDTEVAAIKTKTDSLTFTTANKIDAKLASDGLDNIAITAPSGPAATFREQVVMLYRRFFKRAVIDATTIKTYADDGTTVITTQTRTETATAQTQGAAT